MGYAAPGQVSSGIHMRQYARTFIIDDGDNRVVYVNIDCGMIDQAIKTEVSSKYSNPRDSSGPAEFFTTSSNISKFAE